MSLKNRLLVEKKNLEIKLEEYIGLKQNTETYIREINRELGHIEDFIEVLDLQANIKEVANEH